MLTPVILAVIPPSTTRKTGSDQMDRPADLTSKDVTRCYPVDGREATHNRKVVGSNLTSGASNQQVSGRYGAPAR